MHEERKHRWLKAGFHGRKKGVLTLTLPLKSWTEKAYAAARFKHAAPGESQAEGGQVTATARDAPAHGDAQASHAQAHERPEEEAANASMQGNCEASNSAAVRKQQGEFEKTLRENLRKQSEKSKSGVLHVWQIRTRMFVMCSVQAHAIGMFKAEYLCLVTWANAHMTAAHVKRHSPLHRATRP